MDDIIDKLRMNLLSDEVQPKRMAYVTHNKTAYLALKVIYRLTDWIFPQLDPDTGELACIADEWSMERKKQVLKMIKVILKYMTITVTNPDDLQFMEMDPKGSLARLKSLTSGSPAQQKKVKPRTRGKRTGSIDASKHVNKMSPAQAIAPQTSDSNVLGSLSYGEFLKLRIKKINTFANYMSSEFYKSDLCHSLIENATQIRSLLMKQGETNLYIGKEKTSSQNKVIVDKFRKQFNDNFRDAGNLYQSLSGFPFISSSRCNGS